MKFVLQMFCHFRHFIEDTPPNRMRSVQAMMSYIRFVVHQYYKRTKKTEITYGKLFQLLEDHFRYNVSEGFDVEYSFMDGHPLPFNIELMRSDPNNYFFELLTNNEATLETKLILQHGSIIEEKRYVTVNANVRL